MPYKQLDANTYLVDTQQKDGGFAACFVVVDDGEAAIIDCGSSHSVPHLSSFLSEVKIDAAQVRYVILTHIHLDHAGGSGALLQHLPQARILVHPDGARHMVDSRRLVRGAEMVYGDNTVERLFGVFVNLPQYRVESSTDGMIIDLGKRAMHILHTPGHAWHHQSIVDTRSAICFSGDAMGIAYQRPLTASGERLVFPSTPPSQFSPDAMIESMRRQHQSVAKYFALTHFGLIDNTSALFELLSERVSSYVDLAQLAPEQNTERWLDLQLRQTFLRWLGVPQANGQTILCHFQGDFLLNSKGLARWIRREREKKVNGTSTRQP